MKTVPGPPRSVTASAPGKINVSLHVGPRRQDGYHSLASVFMAVSLREDIRVSVRTQPGIGISLDPASTITLAPGQMPTDASNLAFRAAELLAERAGVAPHIDLRITKRVPVAGGMGGGSADAAATLVACNALWDVGMSREELADLGSLLGADVPFSLLGGAAVGLGVGDRLTRTLVGESLHWVLVPAPFGLSTPAVYGELDRLRELEGLAVPEPLAVDAAMLAALRAADVDALRTLLINDLQRAAVSLAPPLRDLLGLGESLGALSGIVSGSGPTLAFLTQGTTAARRLAEAFAHEGHEAVVVTGPGRGATVDHLE